MARQQLDDLEVGHRFARRVCLQGDAGRIVAVAPDRRLDPPSPRPWPAAHEGEVFTRRARACAEAAGAVCAPRPSARPPGGPRCRGRAGGRFPAARAPPRPRPPGPGDRGPESRSGGPRTDGRRCRRACRRRAGARPRRRCEGRAPPARGWTLADRGVQLEPSPSPSLWLLGRGAPSTSTRFSESSRSATAREPDLLEAGEEAVQAVGRLPRAGPRLRAQASVFGAGRPEGVRLVLGCRSAATSARSSAATPTTMNVSARLNAGQ